MAAGRVRGGLLRACLSLAVWLSVGPARADLPKDARPSLYLSCAAECYESFLHQELSYFDFSRDRFLADYTVVIVRQSTGGGGTRFTVELVPHPRLPQATPVLHRSVSTPPGATPEQMRSALAATLLKLLYEALQGSEHEPAFVLSLPSRSGLVLSGLEDPWQYWVLTPELMGNADAGTRYYFMEATMALTLRRITEDYRIRFRGSYTRRFSGYQLEDDSHISGDVQSYQIRALAARSFGRHFALGGLLTKTTPLRLPGGRLGELLPRGERRRTYVRGSSLPRLFSRRGDQPALRKSSSRSLVPVSRSRPSTRRDASISRRPSIRRRSGFMESSRFLVSFD